MLNHIKHKLKLLFMTFIHVIAFDCIMAQPDDFITNFQKYWNYRYKLLGDRIDPEYPEWETGMVRVGDCPGCSQPPIYAMPLTNNWNHEFQSNDQCGNQLSYAGNPGITQLSGKFGYAENLIQLGKYLIALSTEYKLLKQNNEPTKDVETELYYALQAVEKLDFYAEQQYGMTGQLNGFLARDNVPMNFLWENNDNYNYFGKKYNWIKSDAACTKQAHNCTEDGCDGGEMKMHNEMSKDQALGVLSGLYVVFKILPNIGILSNCPDPSFNAHTYAKDYVIRIIDYIRNAEGSHHWRIVRPQSCIGGPGTSKVCRGSNVKVYSWPLFMIQRAAYGQPWHDAPWPFIGWQNNADGQTIWEWWQWRGATLFANASFVANNAFAPYTPLGYCNDNVSPTQWDGQSYVQPYFNFTMTARLASLYGPHKAKSLLGVTRASIQPKLLGLIGIQSSHHNADDGEMDDEPWFELLSSYLNNYPLPFSHNEFMCKLTYHAPIRAWLLREENGVSYPSNNRRNKKLKYDCNVPAYNYIIEEPTWIPESPIWGNNLDYMITVNLLQLKLPRTYYDLATGKTVNYSNLMKRNVTNSFPVTIGGVAYGNSTTQPLKIHASYILKVSDDAKVVIESGARIDFQAPHPSMEPGFETKYGSVVTMQPGRMECGANTALIPIRSAKTDYDDVAEVEVIQPTEQELYEMELIKKLGIEGYAQYMIDSISKSNPEIAQSLKIDTEERLASNTAIIYPNPNTGEFKIEMVLEMPDDLTIELYDALGRKVHSVASHQHFTEGKHDINFNRSDIQKGMYSLRISGESTNFNTQIIIQ